MIAPGTLGHYQQFRTPDAVKTNISRNDTSDIIIRSHAWASTDQNNE